MLTDLVSSMALKSTFPLHHLVPGADLCGAPLSASLWVATGDNFLSTQLCAHLLWVHSDLVFRTCLLEWGHLKVMSLKYRYIIPFLSTELLSQF